MDTQAGGLAWTFADRIRKVRRHVGRTQEEMAQDLGVGRPGLSAWESGRNEPDDIVGIARKIESAYGIPASWTLGLDDPAPAPVTHLTPRQQATRHRWSQMQDEAADTDR